LRHYFWRPPVFHALLSRLAKGEVQIKDLILGATLTSLKDRDEYLKKQAEAQFAVPEKKLVEEVRRVLSRHKA
ncbi:MAG TPA: hypothetical protein VI075_06575, partial [Methyloceanibacter sp.]